ncbi:MAG: tetratricopeptide repeat protein [Elusimicrobiota bacterium]|jgi:tetratricopeptide (TPR) repeat protein
MNAAAALLSLFLPAASFAAPPTKAPVRAGTTAPQKKPADPKDGERLAAQADALRAQGRDKDAIAVYIRALEVYDEVLAPDDLRLAEALDGLSRSLASQGLYEDAEKMGLKSARIIATVKGPRVLEVAYAAERLARISALDRKLAQSIAYYEQALSIEGETWGPDSPRLSGLLEEYLGILRRTPRKADIARIEGRLASLKSRESQKDSRPRK